MKYFKFLLFGALFGIVLTKAEVTSWYRIYEMFRMQSFHMYGVIGSAVGTGIMIVAIIKRTKMRSWYGNVINIPSKDKAWKRYLFGGIIFGIGWAVVGACPGPLYILMGQGFSVMLVVLVSAVLGTFFYGLLKDKLPH